MPTRPRPVEISGLDGVGIVRQWRALPHTANGRLLLAVAAILAIYLLRVLAVPEHVGGVSLLLIIPVAVVGIDRGSWAGIAAGLCAYAVFLAWASGQVLTNAAPLDHVVRACMYALVGAFAGWSAAHLRAAEQRQRHLADALGDMVSAHDPDGRYLYASSAAKDLLGYEPHQLVGRSAYASFIPTT
ncbi:MAG: PAS domain-containing protein [Solirubrobacteraceae bacterium]